LKNNQLNSLVERYRQGDSVALDELCRKFIPVITKHSESIWYKIESQVEFECRCIKKIKVALENYNPSRGKLSSLVINVIKKEKNDFLSRRKRRHGDIISVDKPLYTDKDGNEVTLDIQDVLADVEKEVIESDSLNKKVALLAKDDSRRLAILKAWIEGETNDLILAKELATTFPDTAETGHRRFIQRFRIECQKQLATV